MIDFDRIKNYRVLLVGDAIMDEYLYVSVIGKSIKEYSISTQFRSKEVFRGGAWAAAEHLKGLCAQVDVMTGAHVMTNRRYVDEIYMRKLLTVHESHESDCSIDCDIGSYDLVVITDFGHGAMTQGLIAKLTKEARFLAVNAQTNSTNYGFNLITKYPRADYVVVDEIEARLAARDRDGAIEDVILALGFKKIIVTMGANGAVGFDGAFERQKALTNRVIDTMGAGDAFLACSAPFACSGASMRDLVRVGNAAGAAKVEIVGHRGSVTREALEAKLVS